MQAQEVKDYVAMRIHRLEGQGEHVRKADLANLRRGIGKTPGDLPVLWGEFLQDLPERLQSLNGMPSPAEWAVYLALTMYALHQQGHALPQDSMNRINEGFGCAVRRLVKDGEDIGGSSILKRFNTLATASGMPELANHLRGMVQLLRAAGIPLDYPQLAEDLYLLQYPYQAPRVRLRWGQEFYRAGKKEAAGEYGQERREE